MPVLKPLNELLTISEACSLLKCHPNTLRYWDKIGVLKAIRFGKRGDRRYKKEDILKLVNSNLSHTSSPESHDTDFLKTELSQSLERMGHFQYITSELSKAVTSQQVADVIIRQTILAFNARSGLIALLHNEDEILKIIHSVGFKKRELKPWDDLPITAPIHLTDALKTGNSVFIESIDEGKIRYPLTTKLAEASNDKSFAASPLKVENRILGVLCISFSEVQKFSEADRLFLQAIANQCAQSLERATLYDKEQKARLQAEESAKSFSKSEERLRLATEASAIYWWELDFKTNTTLYSSNTEKIIGAPPGKTLQENQLLLHPDDRELAVQAFEEAIKNGTNFNYVVRSIAVSSEIRWLQVSGKIIRDNQNNPVLAIGISQNITKRIRHESNLTFLAQMSAQFESASSIEEIMQRVGSMLGEYLGLSRCAFSIVNQDKDKITAVYEWKRDMSLASILGSYRISDLLTKKGRAHYMSGKIAVIPDTKHNTFLAAPPDLLYKSGNAALVDAPFIKDKKWKFLLTIVRSTPSEWRSDETELIHELAARIYTRLERARTEKALRLGKAQLQVLLDETPMGVYMIDADFRIQAVNPTALPVFGETPDLIGRDFTEVIHGLWSKEYADEVVQLFRHTLETGEPYYTPERIEERRDLGVTQYYEWQVNRIPLPDGRNGVVCYFRDVSAQVFARLAIADSEEKYRTLFDNIDEGFSTIEMLFDEAGKACDYRFLETNRVHKELTGLPSTIVGMRASELMPELKKDLLERLEKVVLTGKPIRYEQQVEALGGWFDVHSARVGGKDSRVIANVFTNITERKRRETNLTFLADVSQDLVRLTKVDEMMNQLGAKIGEHFNVARCIFAEVLESENRAIYWEWHRPELFSTGGEADYSQFVNEEYIRRSRAGETIVVQDAYQSPMINGRALEDFFATTSFVTVPLLRGGQWRFTLGIYNSTPRDWRADETELMQELTARIWTRLERARAEEALRETQNKLQLALDAAEMGTYIWYPQEDRADMDARVLALYGVREGESLNVAEALAKHVHPDDRELFATSIARAVELKSDGKLEMEFRVIHPDGSLHWLHSDGQTFFEGENPPRAVLMYGMLLDITERKHTETNLAFLAEVSNELVRLTNIDETMNALGEKIGTYFKATRCAFFEFNEALDEAVCEYDWHQADEPSIVGSYRTSDFYNDEFLKTMRAGKVFVVSNRDSDPLVNAKNLAALNIASYIVIPIARDKQMRYVLSINDSKPRNWDANEIELMRELTSRIWTRLERAHAEEELKLRLSQQDAVAKLGQQALAGMSLTELMDEATATIVATLNCDLSKILELLPNKKELLIRAGVGWRKGVVGKQVISAAKDNLGGYALHLRKPVIFKDLKTEKRFKSPQIHFDHGITSGFHVVILGRKGEDPYGILGACSKTTKVFTQDDINFLQAIANILSEGIERKKIEARKDEFLSMATHELKTPITTIKAYSQILEKRVDAKNTYFTQNINAQVDKISLLIEDLLDIGKIESGKLDYKKQKFDLDALVQKVVVDFQYTTESHQIKKIGKAESLITGDADRIGQVLINLLTNAIKYSPKGGEITVTVKEDTKAVTVSVRDQGLGIPKTNQKHIFEKYFRVSNKGAQKGIGFGLGLYISAEIIKRHHGTIWVESNAGKGSTFCFTIPM